MSVAIRVESLGKQFLIPQGAQPGIANYRTFRESLGDLVRYPMRALGRRGSRYREHWALRDIDFEIGEGEVVGVIGRNGAGKSTLLKILSRITKPTTGCVKCWGRVGSLLEVGTGFHPELTGRENIYLNGSILGMGRRDIDRKFADIVEFAEVETFLEMPVKRYSSGMYVRLAFAVAAFLEPEILLIDEVLAVGDVGFQNKCLRRIREVAGGGRTVIFVSHNMAAIQSLCSRSIVISGGGIVHDGDVNEGISLYAQQFHSISKVDLAAREDRSGNGDARIESVRLLDATGSESANILMGHPFQISLTLKARRLLKRPQIGIAIYTSSGQRLFRLNTVDKNVWFDGITGSYEVSCGLRSNPLLPGTYLASLSINDSEGCLDNVDAAFSFEILVSDVLGSGRIPQGPGDLIYIEADWNTRTLDEVSSAP